MHKRLLVSIAAALTIASLSGAGGAAAVTEEAPPESLPTLAVDALALEPGQRSIRVLVATSYEASVLVYGQVGWGFKTKRGKRARLIVGLSGGRQLVPAGRIASFRVRLPRTVLRRLRRLTPRESLRAKISASATDSAERTALDRVVVRLRGRGAG